MKCPYCEYEHGWSGEIMDMVEGEEGEFFTLSNNVQALRINPCYDNGVEREVVQFCPKCGKCFIEV